MKIAEKDKALAAKDKMLRVLQQRLQEQTEELNNLKIEIEERQQLLNKSSYSIIDSHNKKNLYNRPIQANNDSFVQLQSLEKNKKTVSLK